MVTRKCDIIFFQELFSCYITTLKIIRCETTVSVFPQFCFVRPVSVIYTYYIINSSCAQCWLNIPIISKTSTIPG